MRLSPLLAALGATFALGSAQAVVVTIDNFNSPFSRAFSTGTGNTASATTAVTGGLATGRTITNTITTAAVANPTGTLSSIAVGPSPNFFANALNVANANGIQSTNTIEWTLDPVATAAALATSAPVSLFFDVIASDNGFPASNTILQFTLNGNPLQTFGIPNSGPAQYSFLLSMANRAALSAGGALRVSITGAPGYDFSLDTFGLDLPEPTSVALVGLALLGAGVASRRRKAA